MDYFSHFQKFYKNRKMNFDGLKFGPEAWVACYFSDLNFSLIGSDELLEYYPIG